jgi:hypothetical protein
VPAALKFEMFDMESPDIKTLAEDDNAFRLYVATGLSTLAERLAGLGGRLADMSREVQINRDRLIQIDTQGTHGLGDLRERVAAHEKWMDDIRKNFSDHMNNCPQVGRIAALEESTQRIAEDNAVRAEMLKGVGEMKKKLDDLNVQVAENGAAKVQKERDWRMTITMVGMLLTALFSMIGVLQRMKVP